MQKEISLHDGFIDFLKIINVTFIFLHSCLILINIIFYV